MKYLRRYESVTLAWVVCVGLACSGSSNGNPASPDEDTPLGAELAKSDAPRDMAPKVTDGDAETFASDNRAFAFDLYAQLGSHDENLFFSPYSISVALAMTYAGARTTTEREMAGALHFTLAQPKLHAAFNALDLELRTRKSGSAGDGFRLNVLNQTWVDQSQMLLDGYLDVQATNYDAGVLQVDFAESEATRKLINGWVLEHTAGRIDELLPSGALDVNTRLVLTNAIYLKAKWAYEFDAAKTMTATFHGTSGDRDVEMMHTDLMAGYTEEDTYQALDLAYVSADVRMLLVLPKEGEFDAVAKNIDAILGALSSAESSAVTLNLPRFSFESKKALEAPLKALGMKAAFNDGDDSADFSGIDGSQDLSISGIYHDAFIEVNEQGTEATAGTAVVIAGKSAGGPPPPPIVTCDRPFIFAIYDRPTGQILFLGQLVNPGEE